MHFATCMVCPSIIMKLVVECWKVQPCKQKYRSLSKKVPPQVTSCNLSPRLQNNVKHKQSTHLWLKCITPKMANKSLQTLYPMCPRDKVSILWLSWFFCHTVSPITWIMKTANLFPCSKVIATLLGVLLLWELCLIHVWKPNGIAANRIKARLVLWHEMDTGCQQI